MKRSLVCGALVSLLTVPAWSDVTRVEHQTLKKQLEANKATQSRESRLVARAAAGKPNRTGEHALTDASGFEYFINSDITFSTSSSASGAASEASYTAAVAATTSAGGTTASTLNDAFDGYNSICLTSVGTLGPCSTGGGGEGGPVTYTMYNNNGPGSLDAGCEDGNNLVVLNPQTVGTFSVQRKIYVPDNDEFARWANSITNTGGVSASVRILTANNLGSDADTLIVSSSDGDASPEDSDTWVSTFQDFSGSTTSDPRLGHVFGDGASPLNVTDVTFANGDDHPFWAYDLTLGPGETAIILNYATGQPSRADANAKAAELASGTNANQYNCMSETELGNVRNFSPLGSVPRAPEVPTASTTGLLALMALLAGAAVFVLRRRA